MKLNPDDPVVQDAVFGEQVEQFMRSDIGEYIVNRAKNMSEEFMEKLKTVDPYSTEVVIFYQMKIQIADYLLQWLGEAIAMGLQAREQLESE